ncbi:MAG TPA: hypothetical protein VGK59_21440 [Ohtaekwangia sp.]
MKKNSFSDMISSVDVLNTLYGGISEPYVEFVQFEDRREIYVHVPGIDNESIKIEIHKNVLTIFYSIKLLSGDTLIPMPRVVYSKNIPYFIDASKINAQTEGQGFRLILPYNEKANGFYRNIKLDEV